jgi:hypothetical protein
MSTASFVLAEKQISFGRYARIAVLLYEADGETPLAIAADDNVRFKLWATDGAVPAIEAERAAQNGTTSVVEVTTNGAAGVTPARAVIHLESGDTDGLTVGTQYQGEVILVDNSDYDRAKPMGRFPIQVLGTATGDIDI